MIESSKNKFEFGENGFDLIRYWAAFSVMFLHYTGYALELSSSGRGFLYILRKIVSFFPGVVVLFSLSGFLIAASYERSKFKRDFFEKRVLRMYPELWVCTIVNLIVVCVLVFNLLDKSIIIWMLTQIFGIANTPSCLDSFATGSINGSLWTIFTEVQLYIVLGFLYNSIKKLTAKKWIGMLIGLAVCNVIFDVIDDSMGGTVAKIIERFCLTYAVWFFIGVFCYVKREKLIQKLKIAVPYLLFAYIILYFIPVDFPGYYGNIAISILLPFIVIGGDIACPKFVFLVI